jgi:hypothetical protein
MENGEGMTKGNRAGKQPKPPQKPKRSPKAKGDSWRKKSIEELAAEQGVRLPQDLDELIGQGKDLWRSDEEFEQFLAGIYERRRQGRKP